MLKIIKSHLGLTLPLMAFSAWVGLTPAQAQTMIVENNTKISVDIAASEMTRISVSGDRITLLRGTAGAYTVSNDNTQGAVFIKPVITADKITKTCLLPKNKQKTKKHYKKSCKKHSKPIHAVKPFYLFISTEQGHHYVLNLTPRYHQQADMLVIKPQESVTEAAKIWETSDAYSQTLIRLVDAIIHQKIPDGYTQFTLNKPKEWSVGSQLNLKLTDRYIGAHWDVDIYQITNHSRQTVTITESELFKAGDRAIYLKKTILSPKQSIQMIKVVSHV
jgi:hypothetical protein